MSATITKDLKASIMSATITKDFEASVSSFKDDAESKPATKKEDKYLYTLSSFMTLHNVLPIFYEENIVQNFGRQYFCLFLDRNDQKIKVLAYTTRDRNESAYGVGLKHLMDGCVTVTNGSQFKNLEKMSQSIFFKENFALLAELFGQSDIRKFLNTLYQITKDIGKSKREIRKVDGFAFYNAEMPVSTNMKTVRDILGKSAFKRDGVMYSAVHVYPDYDIIGFADVNFITTAHALYNQYTIYHRIKRFLRNCFNTLKKIKKLRQLRSF